MAIIYFVFVDCRGEKRLERLVETLVILGLAKFQIGHPLVSAMSGRGMAVSLYRQLPVQRKEPRVVEIRTGDDRSTFLLSQI